MTALSDATTRPEPAEAVQDNAIECTTIRTGRWSWVSVAAASGSPVRWYGHAWTSRSAQRKAMAKAWAEVDRG